MEAAQLTSLQPLLLLVVGVPGSGKSYFARQFAESYKFFYINAGRYSVEIEASLGSTKEAERLGKNLALATFGQTLGSFKHVVLEGPFDMARERESIINTAKKAGFKVLTVWVQTDEETCYGRAMNRDRRRADDRSSLNLTRDEMDEAVGRFQKPNPSKENTVVISGKHGFKSQGVSVLKKIAGMYVPKPSVEGSVQSNVQSSPARPATKKIGIS